MNKKFSMSRVYPPRDEKIGVVNKPRLNPAVLADLSWWQWATTIPMLAMHIAGRPWVIYVALAVCLTLTVHYAVRLRSVKPYPVQIRVGYTLLLIIGLFPAMQWVHWVQLAGTTAMVTVGYCPMARFLALAGWNRNEPMNVALVRRVALAPPHGGLIQLSPRINAQAKKMSCSLVKP